MNRLNTAIFIFDGVEVLDFAGPFEVFSRTRLVPGVESRRSDASAPFNVFTVARLADTVHATGGLRVLPHFDFASAPPIDLLVIPGGFGTRQLLDDRSSSRTRTARSRRLSRAGHLVPAVPMERSRFQGPRTFEALRCAHASFDERVFRLDGRNRQRTERHERCASTAHHLCAVRGRHRSRPIHSRCRTAISRRVDCGRSATVDGLTLQYLEAGRGPGVVLLHGYTETSRM